MPRVNLNYHSPKNAPPIDWLWAAVLERKVVLGYDLRLMARIAGVSYETMRQYIRKSPWDWDDEARDRICKEFCIVPQRTVTYAPPQEGGYR